MKSNRYFLSIGWGLSALALTGCGGLFKPQKDLSRFYVLSSMTLVDYEPEDALGDKLEDEAIDLSVRVLPAELPSYLDRPQIVTRLKNNEIKISEYNRWAEPLENGVTSSLSQNLSILLNSGHVFRRAKVNLDENDYEISISISSFEGNTQGEVVLSGRWWINGYQENAVLLEEDFFITKIYNPSSGDYNSYVSALSEALAQLSQNVSKALEEVYATMHGPQLTAPIVETDDVVPSEIANEHSISVAKNQVTPKIGTRTEFSAPGKISAFRGYSESQRHAQIQERLRRLKSVIGKYQPTSRYSDKTPSNPNKLVKDISDDEAIKPNDSIELDRRKEISKQLGPLRRAL